MPEPQIRFNDGAAYERTMGIWSRYVGDIFLDWLAPPPNLRWVDVGCGNGAFSAALIEHCAPASVDGVDPSDGQLRFARARPDAALARFHEGDAMALPFPDGSFDAAVMALVIFFVPEPAKGVAEMVRVTRPGGLISAYAWDVEGGGFPGNFVWEALRSVGIQPARPPNPQAARLDALTALWTNAGLVDVETRTITVSRTFANFDEFWTTTTPIQLAAVRDSFQPGDEERIRDYVAKHLPPDADGRITYSSRANAVKGRMPSA